MKGERDAEDRLPNKLFGEMWCDHINSKFCAAVGWLRGQAVCCTLWDMADRGHPE